MTDPARRVSSPERLRLVLILLTVVPLPFVIGASILIYTYVRFGVMVDRRLQGERWMTPSRIYARRLSLRGGLPVGSGDLGKVRNGLKWEQRSGGPPAPGTFAIGERDVTFAPRPIPGAAPEPLRVIFDKEKVKEIRGLESRKHYPEETLEPELITYLFDESREKRRRVQYEELPDHLVKAVLAIEDRRFFSHPSLDPFRIAAAPLRNIKADTYVQCGSTITQQLCKNFFLTPEKSFKRKAQEAALAFVLDRRGGKKDNLELYLNEIYLRPPGAFRINGRGQAARTDLHKDMAHLTPPTP